MNQAPPQARVVLISTNAGTNMGGEAIKAFQFFKYLLDQGFDACLLTHGRNRHELAGAFPTDRLIFIDDTPLQSFAWKSFLLRPVVPLYFHLAAAALIRRHFKPDSTILHYLCPVSPVAPRFQPRGFRVIMGPFTGNIPYPPAFAYRMGWRLRLTARLHRPVQRLLGMVFGDKRRADRILVSGYERTRESLLAAGCAPERLVDVADAGVSDAVASQPRIRHAGRNPRFVMSGRHDPHKGIDLALRALARTPPDITLTIFGDGAVRPRMEALTEELGLRGRVEFAGWQPHDTLLARLRDYRGYVFPSLAEANGIVVQEAMMLGLPVVTLLWGGPEMLGDATTCHYVGVGDEEQVVAGLAEAMERLAGDGAYAEALAEAARARAEARFRWETVAASWTAQYGALIPGADQPAPDRSRTDGIDAGRRSR